MVGISNFVTFLENTAVYRRDQRRTEYGDERDPAMRARLVQMSPLTHAHKIRKPLLILQGANDPRVPASEGEQIKAALQTNGLECWYVLALDEGHGFAKRFNQSYYLNTMLLFLHKHLLHRTIGGPDGGH